MTDVLIAESLCKAFGGNQVLDGVSVRVARGEVVALVGPNGAGKTSLLNMLSGQLRLDSGKIVFDGHDVTRCSPAHRHRRRLVRSYQDGGVFGDLDVVQNISVPLIARGVRHDVANRKADDAVRRFGLAAVRTSPAKRLSGGQRKLIDYARVSVCDVSLQLLDEPTAGVLPHMCETMAGSIRERSTEGVASIVISHDLPWAMSIASRIVVLARGKVLAEGSPEQVQANDEVKEAYLR